MSFKVEQLKIPGLLLITPTIRQDNRGFFLESYKRPDFSRMGIDKEFVQVNHSRSYKNVVRGMHYQISPMAQPKLVKAITGAVFDVAVDIRKGSPYFGQWVGVELDEKDLKMFYIPEGFAHGFCVLSERADVEYYSSAVYSPQHERGIVWNDPSVKIQWPVKNPVVSEKDAGLPALKSAETNFVYQ